MIASMSGAMLNLVLIMALGRVYEKLAYGLTTWGKLQPSIIIATAVLNPHWCCLHCLETLYQRQKPARAQNLSLYLRL